jgi:phosphohistidine phosphatase
MLITCLRHATAEPHGLPSDDVSRALIDKGREQVSRVADFCRRNRLLPGALYTSPLRRARQTADILQARLAGCPAVITADWLALGASPMAIVAELADLSRAGIDDVWLVGHEPDLSCLVCYLLATADDAMLIKKASLTRLELSTFKAGGGRLSWSVPCSLMH